MAKKIDIGSKEFTKLLQGSETKPHPQIIKNIDAKMFPLDQNKVFNFKPEVLAYQEFNRCLSLFQDRNPGLPAGHAISRVAGVQSLITREEANVAKELEDLAVNTIKNIYQVPDYVDLKGFIKPQLNLGTKQDHDPKSFIELTLEQKNNMRDEIQKRVILNGLVHGSSMHIWKGLYHLVSDELEEINPNLKELYNHYTSTIGIHLWLMNPKDLEEAIQEETQLTQGFNKLKFNKQEPGGSVEANAINFPVLLHELNKGVIDWLISAGIPKEYTEAELRYYYAKADNYENEFYHYLLSPTLWIRLLEINHIDNQDIPKLVSDLSQLSYQELVDLFRKILETEK